MKNREMVKKALDIMQALEGKIGETIGLGALLEESAEGIVLAEVQGTSGVAVHIQVGYHIPLHTSAPGKIFLAYLPPEQRENLLSRMMFDQYTPSTILKKDDFRSELESVAEKGFALDVSEQLVGFHCVGVPVLDEQRQVVGCLWTTGPSSQLPVRRFPEISDIMKKGAQELSLRLRSSGRNPDRSYMLSVIDQAKEIIQHHLHAPLDMQELAANLYVSYSWFRKGFKEQTGEAPAEYHLRLRIEKACDLLCSTDLPVRQISEELGFKNQNHFSALFKRKTGASPIHYRAPR